MLPPYEILPHRSLVRVTYHFHPTHQQWMQMMNEIFNDPHFVPGFHFLFDKREAGEAASTVYVEHVARYYRHHQAKMGRCAIVTGDLLAFGMARMTEGHCAAEQVRAFMSIEEAEQWLRSSKKLPAEGLAA